MGQVSGVAYEGASMMMMSTNGGMDQSNGGTSGSGNFQYSIKWNKTNGFTGISWTNNGYTFSESEVLGMSNADRYALAQNLLSNWAFKQAGCVTVTETV